MSAYIIIEQYEILNAKPEFEEIINCYLIFHQIFNGFIAFDFFEIIWYRRSPRIYKTMYFFLSKKKTCATFTYIEMEGVEPYLYLYML